MEEERLVRVLGLLAHHVFSLEELFADQMKLVDILWDMLYDHEEQSHLSVLGKWIEQWDVTVSNMLKDNEEKFAEQGHSLYDIEKRILGSKRKSKYT